MDLENIVHIRPLSDCVKRSGCHGVDLPEIVKSLICEIEDRGLIVPNIYQKAGAKAGFIFEKVFFSRTEILGIYFENFLHTPGQTCPSGRDIDPKGEDPGFESHCDRRIIQTL